MIVFSFFTNFKTDCEMRFSYEFLKSSIWSFYSDFRSFGKIINKNIIIPIREILKLGPVYDIVRIINEFLIISITNLHKFLKRNFLFSDWTHKFRNLNSKVCFWPNKTVLLWISKWSRTIDIARHNSAQNPV